MIVYSKFQLPNNIREGLLTRGCVHVALVLDSLYQSGLRSFNGVLEILAHLQDNGFGLGEWALRKGLREAEALGVLHTREYISEKRGRPKKEYRLPSVGDLMAELAIKHQFGAADEIPVTAFQSPKEYRKALFAAFIKRVKGIQMGRKKLGRRLGISARTTFTYEREIQEVKHHQQFGERVLSIEALSELPSKLESTDKSRGRFFLIAETEREMTDAEKDSYFSWVTPSQRAALNPPAKKERSRFPLLRELAYKLQAAGYQLYVAWQEANYYYWDDSLDERDNHA